MKINRIKINNYRNLRDIDIHISDIVAVIGENNSGKSNFLRAITLPFLTDEYSQVNKNLSWAEVNRDAKNEYYSKVIKYQDAILKDTMSELDFMNLLPIVSVEVELKPDKTEAFFVKDLSFDVCDDDIKYGLRYEFKPAKIDKIMKVVKNVLSKKHYSTLDEINEIKMNLLPIEYYSYSIYVPGKESVPYDVLKLYKYTALEAERDDFSRTKDRIGSKALIKLFQSRLENDDKIKIEEEYTRFFDQVKSISKIDSLINWHETSNIQEAKRFFSHVSILPNMPSMQSLLSSVRLGYDEETLSLQGLGYRNLILLFILVHSLVEKQDDIALNILTIEEPESHLCINNIRLMVSFFKAFAINNHIIQLFYSTHDTEFINKMKLENVVIIHDGQAFSFKDELKEEELDYLSKNPNLDLFKLFFSKKCLVFEGVTEELLIRSYIDSKKELNDIELISFHKGFTKLIEIWKKVNKKTKNRLGIIRDYDNQPKAKEKHNEFNDDLICIRTTKGYTLETDLINTGDNYQILKKRYGEVLGWANLDKEEMEKAWKEAKASDMLIICKDIVNGKLSNLDMPSHIQEVLDFLNRKE